MGLDLTSNFNHPYLSISLSEFWTRWHVSLSSWLREYIFFPLNRSRLGRGKPHLNLWITMLVSGLWHGAAWHFILWGGLHALFTSLERLTGWPMRLQKAAQGKSLAWGKALAWLLVLLEVWIGWVFFRAASIPQGWQILKTMFSFQNAPAPPLDPLVSAALLLALLRELFAALHLRQKLRLPAWLQNGLEVAFISLLICAAVLLRGPGSQFIYFQF
jgi:alginate O-acetyltransferase complex protein AlgI